MARRRKMRRPAPARAFTRSAPRRRDPIGAPLVVDTFGDPRMVPDGGMPLPDFNPMVAPGDNLPFANPEPDGGGIDGGYGPGPAIPMPPLPPELTRRGKSRIPMPPGGFSRGGGQQLPDFPDSVLQSGDGMDLLSMLRALFQRGNVGGQMPMQPPRRGNNPLMELLMRGGLGRR